MYGEQAFIYIKDGIIGSVNSGGGFIGFIVQPFLIEGAEKLPSVYLPHLRFGGFEEWVITLILNIMFYSPQLMSYWISPFKGLHKYISDPLMMWMATTLIKMAIDGRISEEF